MTHDTDERTIGKILEKLENIEKNFVTQQEFFPVRVIAYGFVGIVLITVVGLMVSNAISIKKNVEAAQIVNQTLE